jgi:hypothetical protein
MRRADFGHAGMCLRIIFDNFSFELFHEQDFSTLIALAWWGILRYDSAAMYTSTLLISFSFFAVSRTAITPPLCALI